MSVIVAVLINTGFSQVLSSRKSVETVLTVSPGLVSARPEVRMTPPI